MQTPIEIIVRADDHQCTLTSQRQSGIDGPSAIRASTYIDKYNLNETKPQDLATSHQEMQGMKNMLNVNTGMKPAYPHLGTPNEVKGKNTDKVGTCILKKNLRDI